MAEQVTIPEPPDQHGLYWRATGTGEYPVVMIRDDRLATEWEWTDGPEARWFEANSDGEPMTFADMCEHSDGEGYPMSEAVVLVPQPEVDRLVAEARRAAGLTFVGDHPVEPGGYCRRCGSKHSPEELARIEDRLDEGAGRG